MKPGRRKFLHLAAGAVVLPAVSRVARAHARTITMIVLLALGLALLPSSIVAQQGTLKEQLVGTWTLVSDPNPAIVQRVGTNPKGFFMMDGGGRYVQMLEKSDRPKSDRRGDSVLAEFGTWSVNEAERILMLHVDGSVNPNLEGIDVKFSISVTGDELKVTDTREIVYRRAR